MFETEKRKSEHIRVCLDNDIERESTLFEDVTLVHQTFTDLSLDDIDTSVYFFGKKLSMPLMIAAITGGAEISKKINKDLAGVAEKKQIGFGLGSQRAMIENENLTETYYVRDVAKNALIFGNIGIAQLRNYSVEQIRKAIEKIEADAICVHFNSAQEMFQIEGDYNFKGSTRSLEKLCNELGYPVIAKEVGNGFSREVALKLKELGVKAIDVGGMGGSNWIVVDALRSNTNYNNFENWGIPTACSILESSVGLPIIATGGIRNGLDMAKAIVLGAEICGIALPFLKVLDKEGKPGLEKYIDQIHKELKIIMLLTGSRNIAELKKAKYVITGKLKDWKDCRKL